MTIYDELAWMNMPEAIRQQFYNIAAKGEWTAREAFAHLVPSEIRNDPEKIEVFMDGGTASTVEWTYDRGRAGGQYETVEHDIADKDVSRIEAGGDYSTDNTVMEDASPNRARGAEDMTDTEYQDILEANSAEAELLSEATIVTEDVASSGTDLIAEGLGTVAECAAAGFIGYKVGKYIHTNTSHMSDEDRDALAVLGAGGTVALAFTPPGMFVAGVYGTWKLMGLAWKAGKWGISKLA